MLFVLMIFITYDRFPGIKPKSTETCTKYIFSLLLVLGVGSRASTSPLLGKTPSPSIYTPGTTLCLVTGAI